MASTLKERIMRALERGPLYDGIIDYVVSAPSRSATTRALRDLQDEGKVVRVGMTWKASA